MHFKLSRAYKVSRLTYKHVCSWFLHAVLKMSEKDTFGKMYIHVYTGEGVKTARMIAKIIYGIIILHLRI